MLFMATLPCLAGKNSTPAMLSNETLAGLTNQNLQ